MLIIQAATVNPIPQLHDQTSKPRFHNASGFGSRREFPPPQQSPMMGARDKSAGENLEP